jgi:phosphomethylpyrimidine synthase
VGDATDPLNLTWLGPAEGSESPRADTFPVVGPLRFSDPRRTAMERTKFTGDTATQMHHARRGTITPEMKRVAEREETAPETIRDEVARGRMVIPANVNHAALDPMAIGINARCKINANIGNSAVTSNVEEELEKLHYSVHFGADTVMDLSTGGGIDEIRAAIIAASPVPIGTVPIYQAVQQVTRVEDLTADDLIGNIEHQAQQGVDYMTVHCGVLYEHLPLVQHRITGIVSRGARCTRSGWSTIGSRTRSSSITTRSWRSRASTT